MPTRIFPPSSRFWRVAPRLAAATAVVLIAAAIAAAFFIERAYTDQKQREVSVSAGILASTVTAALVFDDVSAAREYVEALAANPEILSAAVYDETGALFASYARTSDSRPPATAGLALIAVGGDRVAVSVPVRHEGKVIGTVNLLSTIEPLASRLPRYALILLLTLMAAAVVAVLGAAQSALAHVNEELRERARQLQDQIVEREKAEDALRQIQKMETIGQLTGGVAHDFNNLLTIIIGNLDRLERRIDAKADAAELKKVAKFARIGADRAATLTKSLLAFSRRQPLDPKPLDANKLVSNMSDLLRRTLGEHITVQMVGGAGLWRTQADPNQLENAILNLAVNARDAMPEGGRLTIETANAYFDPHHAAQAEVEPGQYIVIAVTDTGGGMTKEVAAQAFEPFFTTKDTSHGTGLGLSQVYGFVKQSGGHVQIYTELGQGTTVKIYLPRLTAEPEAEEVETAPDSVEGRHETILLVEDDPGVRENSAMMLQELGYRVIGASTGAETLQTLERNRQVALLFTDVGLPGSMNGRQLADEVRRRRPELPVLFTTGYARNAIVHDGRLDPGVHLVTKPFSYADLSTALRNLLEARADRTAEARKP
ncbi:MAG: response regulator [Alphaproteobacteria bacterium]|nr:response regulator [Alphaproteobacteria bacterium]